MPTQTKLKRFQQAVLNKYDVFNSIFTTLPFEGVKHTGVLLPLFEDLCQKMYDKGHTPSEIVKAFMDKYVKPENDEEVIDFLFRFIQYVERQVVLFDAIEESAFPYVHNLDGIGTMRNYKELAEVENKTEALKKHLNHSSVRIVLTAHPTQFYPGEVLGIITDLALAIEQDDLNLIKDLLAQLGKTPFFKHQKPDPYEEATRLIWYLKYILYLAISEIYDYISENIYNDKTLKNPLIQIGFWPGGDRDGNPFVTTKTTLKVAESLRLSILENYYKDIKKLKRRLTFKGIIDRVDDLQNLLNDALFYPYKKLSFTANDLINSLQNIHHELTEKHHGLFADEVQLLIHKINLFGLFFAHLDIRQDSRIHDKVINDIFQINVQLVPKNYQNLSEVDKLNSLAQIDYQQLNTTFKYDMTNKTLSSIKAIKTIQKNNGKRAAHRYIISNASKATDVMNVYTLLRLGGFNGKIPLDIVPLFESVETLKNADKVMKLLYENPVYAKHLKSRNNEQHIMLGFSDGTKDGGYLMANWGIYQAKEALTKISRDYGITVVFFDGRGGPPARGGGKSHQFYASFSNAIEQKSIQLTIQGQTISTNYGSIPAAKYNLEQLLGAGVAHEVFYQPENELSDQNRQVLNDLAQLSYESYTTFKAHPKFLPYLERMSTLQYYGKTNIGSRPSKRSQSDALVFSDLRAIPFVGSWSQLKQNVPGFFGFGSAIEQYEKQGRFEEIVQLYQSSNFFKTLVQNSMMSMSKTNFNVTRYMQNDPDFGAFWNIIYEEFLRTKQLLLKLTGQDELMDSYPHSMASINTRERIVLPLLTIQQYALQNIQNLKKQSSADEKSLDIYEKLVIRSLYGNINASRNSV